MPEMLAIVDDERFDDHVAPGPHPERPERLVAARDALRDAVPEAQRLRLEPREATAAELTAVHAPAYVATLQAALGPQRYGHLDPDTFHSPGSREAAWLAAGGAVSLAETLMTSEVRRGVALLRPPGHHAEEDRAMGFCLLNNVAIAAEAARRSGARRVAIVDWDVHHGNGTQHTFEGRSDVGFVSLHQYPFYPGTGAPEQIGRGEGRGSTVNVALPAGAGDDDMAFAFKQVVLPALERWAPDLILVSAGFDAHQRDPLASLELSTEMYAAMATSLISLAERLGHGRVGFVLEGGYDLRALHDSLRATLIAALGKATELPEGAPSEDTAKSIARTEVALAAVP